MIWSLKSTREWFTKVRHPQQSISFIMAHHGRKHLPHSDCFQLHAAADFGINSTHLTRFTSKEIDSYYI